VDSVRNSVGTKRTPGVFWCDAIRPIRCRPVRTPARRPLEAETALRIKACDAAATAANSITYHVSRWLPGGMRRSPSGVAAHCRQLSHLSLRLLTPRNTALMEQGSSR
jgi:hypothetical protein